MFISADVNDYRNMFVSADVNDYRNNRNIAIIAIFKTCDYRNRDYSNCHNRPITRQRAKGKQQERKDKR